MKKNILWAIFLCLNTVNLMAQLEIKTQPLITFLPLKSPNIALEYGIKPYLGIEIGYRYVGGRSVFNKNSESRANTFNISIKRYVKDDVVLSNMYLGGYSSFFKGNIAQLNNMTMYAVGLTGGYKKLFFNNHFVLEPSLNLGKRFSYKNGQPLRDKDFDSNQIKFFYYWDINLRILIGYRF